MTKNKFGLSRNIPNPIKKSIRRRCGFGCVICGSAIITYEHFDPPFAEARQHDPRGITLLCGHHQLESTKGLLSKASIGQADLKPYCKSAGFAKHIFDLGGARPKLLIGGNDFTECGPRIVLAGQTLFEVLPPERKSNRWRLSAKFSDPARKTICEIKENELLVGADNFDAQQTATKFSVSLADGTVFLDLELQPPKALLLKKYALATAEGNVTIGEQLVQIPGEQARKNTMLVFQTSSSKLTFDSCSFASPEGIFFSFKNGGVTFGSQ